MRGPKVKEIGAEPRARDQSAIMRTVGSANTDMEVRLRRALWRLGSRFRLGLRVERTRPDLVFQKARVAVFVDGCFWHGCPWHFRLPKSNQSYWANKITGNRQRDWQDTARLNAVGWDVIRVWGCQIKSDASSVALVIAESVRQRMAAARSGKKSIDQYTPPEAMRQRWELPLLTGMGWSGLDDDELKAVSRQQPPLVES